MHNFDMFTNSIAVSSSGMTSMTSPIVAIATTELYLLPYSDDYQNIHAVDFMFISLEL